MYESFNSVKPVCRSPLVRSPLYQPISVAFLCTSLLMWSPVIEPAIVEPLSAKSKVQTSYVINPKNTFQVLLYSYQRKVVCLVRVIPDQLGHTSVASTCT